MARGRRDNQSLRIPTLAEHAAFDGAHCKNIYRSLPPGWVCPGCGRNTFQILRWTLLYPKSPAPFEGWAGGYHRHHDHAVDPFRYGQSPVPVTPRFSETIICEQCNSADGAAKRKLGLPSGFSFAPHEIRMFVTATAHGFHVVNYDVAAAIHRGVEP